MVVGGHEGSTRGLRFNPRESAEELQDDSSVGREDSEERALHDAKKREEQDKRARKLQGIQHMKIKIPVLNAISSLYHMCFIYELDYFTVSQNGTLSQSFFQSFSQWVGHFHNHFYNGLGHFHNEHWKNDCETYPKYCKSDPKGKFHNA